MSMLMERELEETRSSEVFFMGIRILLKARRMLICHCSQPTLVKLKCELKKALSLKSRLVNC